MSKEWIDIEERKPFIGMKCQLKVNVTDGQFDNYNIVVDAKYCEFGWDCDELHRFIDWEILYWRPK